MNKNKDYYGILGISPRAEDIVIKAAYRALANRYHPDKNQTPSPETIKRMAEINEAWEVLADPIRRKAYDLSSDTGTSTHQPPSSSPPKTESAPPKSPETIYYSDTQRRLYNQDQIMRRAPLFEFFSGKVRSYLSEKGVVLLNKEGNLADGEVVSRKEHLNRLKSVYEELWQERLRLGETEKNERVRLWMLSDAMQRLSLSKRGRLLSPVDRGGYKLTLDSTQTVKKIFGGTKIVDSKLPVVSIAEYDRRLRRFIYVVYTRSSFGGFKIGDRGAIDCSPYDLIMTFMAYPQRRK